MSTSCKPSENGLFGLARYLILALVVVGFSGLGKVGVAGGPDRSPFTWSATSVAGKYLIQVAPAQRAIPIGRHHVWTARLTTQDGATVSNAKLNITGGMLAHGHGMPSQPIVTGEKMPGLYQVEGMQFNMHGDWTLVVSIDASAGPDSARIPLTVEF